MSRSWSIGYKGDKIMDELKRLDNNQYAYLRHLSIERLLELLNVAPVPASCPEDEAYVDALEEAIIEKENENPTGFFPDVDQQWEQFVTQYLPEIEETALEPERMEHADLAQTKQQPLEVPPKRVIPLRRVWRTALVAAAAIVCMFAVMVTAQAAGVDVFGAMARWTEDIFSFGQIPSDSQVSDNLDGEADGQEFSSLQEALDAYGMTEVHEPSWLPEGYALDGVDVLAVDDPFLQSFSASYTDGAGFVGIGIVSYDGTPATQVQKVGGPVKSVEKNGIMFYHIENSVGRTIAWYSKQYEYYINGDLGDDILWKVVESMFM